MDLLHNTALVHVICGSLNPILAPRCHFGTGKSLTFVRTRETVVTLYLLPGLPYVAFTLAGVLMWKRWHSIATSLVALGFAAVLVVKVARLYTYLTFQPPAQAHQQGEPFTFSLYYVAVPLWQHYLELLGLWAAALGLLWHASLKR